MTGEQARTSEPPTTCIIGAGCSGFTMAKRAFPAPTEMDTTIVEDERQHLGHFYDSPRHRMQVDFTTYVADLHKEIERGRARVEAAAA